MFTRWLTVSLVALGLGVAALEHSASVAVEPYAAWGTSTTALSTDAVGPGLPIGAEIDSTEVSALPRFTW
ncbi:MAG TPA: hypothetical protein VMQ51_21160 [Candidatus Binatia bacterium]|nr:hypothetical protein [Candidatus Binatia bacterium]